ncbi:MULTISPECIES: metal ABC transporter solute-binding protein, Zn/Mn family [Microbacterium]|uniref:metal ABC transporter solute-binding protein, Zn/Mn family n=1 Tax=Microbacterium TaxID=33882 RepID=UPI002783254C|nr:MULTISPECIES: zinc ABC transporter substrate-binding protein [Microbacterium]MDQ1082184.1 zinc/manganese transport system substrate-binding protein [Microbacterium sp. SORGH_AS_0344]MDQ1169045.1 zinc/manganese transport system substrate-binding protein [Microbacterium proteolyticum]
MTRRILAPAVLGAASVLALAGCAGGAPSSSVSGAAEDGKIAVVASTDVYGSIAEAIGGDYVDVTSIITSSSQDPHEYEATAQDQLTLKNAGLVIENGAGYDSFMESLIEASGTTASVITAVEFNHDYPGAASHDDAHGDEATAEPSASADEHAEGDGHDHAEGDGHDHIEGFNEHVWYDPHTVEDLVNEIAEHLGELAPDHAADFTANAEAFTGEIAGLEDSLDQIKAKDAGAKVFVTEPVPVYLIDAAGLDNATPNEFSESVEEGQDVPPATLLESLQLLDSGQVRVMIVNPQTGGAETTQVVDEAKSKNIPVIEFTETLPEGQTYISWMQSNITALSDALAA